MLHAIAVSTWAKHCTVVVWTPPEGHCIYRNHEYGISTGFGASQKRLRQLDGMRPTDN